VAREWHGKNKPIWTPGHADTTLERLERDVFPWLGQQPIDKIKAPDVLRVLRRVESRGAIETAHRIKTLRGQVFRYSVATGRADSDPAAALKGALPSAKVKHRAAITEPNKFADLLRVIDGYEGSFVVKCALQIQALTFVSPGELRHAEWSEIDLDAAQWNIPAEKMKLRLPHVVPLSTQAVDILKELEPLTGKGSQNLTHLSCHHPLRLTGKYINRLNRPRFLIFLECLTCPHTDTKQKSRSMKLNKSYSGLLEKGLRKGKNSIVIRFTKTDDQTAFKPGVTIRSVTNDHKSKEVFKYEPKDAIEGTHTFTFTAGE
jgi:integrase